MERTESIGRKFQRVESIGRTASGSQKPGFQRVESLGRSKSSASVSAAKQNFRQMRHEQMRREAMGVGSAPGEAGRRVSATPNWFRRASSEGNESRGADELITAVKHGNLGEMERILKPVREGGSGANPREFGSNGETALHYAAMMGFKEAVELMVPLGRQGEHGSADVNAKTWHRFNLVGAEEGKKKKKGREADYEAEGPEEEDKGWTGKTALHYASLAGHPEIVSMLCDRRARPKAIDNSAPDLKPPQGNTPLHYAAIGGSLASVQVLLDQNKKRYENPPPLEGLAVVGETVLVRKADKSGYEEVEVVERYWQDRDGTKHKYEISDYDGVVEASYVVKPPGGTRAQYMTTKQRRLYKFVAPLVDVNQRNGDGNSALHFATSGGHKEMVDILLRNKANVNAQGDWRDYFEPVPFCGRTPLHNARDHEVAELLLARGADIHALDNAQMTPLHHSAVEGAYRVAAAIIRVLIEELRHAVEAPRSGDDPEAPEKYKPDHIIDYITAKDNLGQTPLHIASYWGHSEFYKRVAQALKAMGPYEQEAQVLLKKEDDVHMKDESGRTRLHHAAWGGSVKEIEHLLTRERKAKVDVDDKKGKTPLHYAAIYGHPEACKALMKFRADPNVVDRGDWESNSKHLAVRRPGYTPLHHAARKGYAHVAKVLVEGVGDNRADPKARSDDGDVGETPYQVAKHFKWNETDAVRDYLRQNGGGGGPGGCTIC
mmetsp:Transcript_14526/g.34420  ORF Transcript_14526/g.34420 Transcript_14526/m.34420 type:complete len:718 (-) Transcript_14526:84-2237(-)